MHNTIAAGVVHGVPADLQSALVASLKALTAWQIITPLARNEWICWILEAKKEQTRIHRIQRTCSDLIGGKKRPCCWAGCPHRKKGKQVTNG